MKKMKGNRIVYEWGKIRKLLIKKIDKRIIEIDRNSGNRRGNGMGLRKMSSGKKKEEGEISMVKKEKKNILGIERERRNGKEIEERI